MTLTEQDYAALLQQALDDIEPRNIHKGDSIDRVVGAAQSILEELLPDTRVLVRPKLATVCETSRSVILQVQLIRGEE
jgi:hypothetical protein